MSGGVMRSGVDAYVQASHPNRHYDGGDRLKVRAGEAVAYLRFHIDMLRAYDEDETIQQVLLTLYPAPGWSGQSALTLRRVQRWSASKVTWNTRPEAIGATPDGAPGIGATLTNGRWLFDVTADAIAWLAGEPNYGWSVAADNFNGILIHGFKAARSKDRPMLDYVVTFAPSKPTNLRPSSAATSVPKPRLTFVTDSQPSTTDTTDDINALQVQVDPAANATAPAFDSGWVTSEASMFDLATSTYPGLAAAASTSWRVRVRNSYGTSKWSDWATFSYVPLPALAITDPPATTNDPTPLIAWTFPGQTQRRVVITDPNDGGLLVHDSGWQATTDHQYVPLGTPSNPEGVVWTGEGPLEVEVRARDGVVREATPGARDHARAAKVVTFVYAAGVIAVDYLVVIQHDTLPVPVLRWDRTEAPDGGWLVLRDGDIVARIEDPLEVRTDSTYTWIDWSGAPNREHSYEIRPVVNGSAGENGPIAYFSGEFKGTWLIDPDHDERWVVLGDASFELAYGESTTVHTPVEAAASVKVNHGLRGLEGSVEGLISERCGRTWQEQEADLFAMKASGARPYRLVFGDLNIPVLIYNVTSLVTPQTRPRNWRQSVRFDVLQQGELPWST